MLFVVCEGGRHRHLHCAEEGPGNQSPAGGASGGEETPPGDGEEVLVGHRGPPNHSM